IEELYERITFSASNSLNSALDMLQEVQNFNEYLIRKNQNPISIGIGITTGSLILGIVGSSNRIESTVIGSTVNLAARIEGLTSYYKTNLLISEFTRAVLPDADKYLFREIDLVIPKGTTHPFYLYEVFNSDPEEIKWKKLESQSLLQEGIHHYRNKNFLQAKNLFFEVLKILPSDPIPQIYIERIQFFLKNPPPSNWNGVWKFFEK
ncbi:MAG: adenylate/guanylate cyclase domain-containing protein, partial [Leptospiraceae bacterium]|nr:adenylate/guanylate cyclase domain-containing protein [Leptospiraceae bacterium]